MPRAAVRWSRCNTSVPEGVSCHPLDIANPHEQASHQHAESRHGRGVGEQVPMGPERLKQRAGMVAGRTGFVWPSDGGMRCRIALYGQTWYMIRTQDRDMPDVDRFGIGRHHLDRADIILRRPPRHQAGRAGTTPARYRLCAGIGTPRGRASYGRNRAPQCALCGGTDRQRWAHNGDPGVRDCPIIAWPEGLDVRQIPCAPFDAIWGSHVPIPA